MSPPELLRELSVCVCVCMSEHEAPSSPLDITVSSLISGLFEDCETGQDQLLYEGMFFEWHILWTMQEYLKKKGLTDSLDVQPFIAVTNINVM